MDGTTLDRIRKSRGIRNKMNDYTLEFRYEELNKIVSFVQFQTELNQKDKNKIQKAIFKELHKIQDLQIKRSMK